MLQFDSMYYTGVGSRDLPQHQAKIIIQLAKQLADEGWILRSGAALGADEAFESGSDLISTKQKRIYLPWAKFNGHSSQLTIIPPTTTAIAAKHHPTWKTLPDPTKLLMARNVQQVLGELLNEPSSFIVCWTNDGCEDGSLTTAETGGTGQCIRLAKTYNIPVFNLKNYNAVDRLFDFLK